MTPKEQEHFIEQMKNIHGLSEFFVALATEENVENKSQLGTPEMDVAAKQSACRVLLALAYKLRT